MIKNFTQFGHCFLACLLLSLISFKGFSKSLYSSSPSVIFTDSKNEYTSFDAIVKNSSVNLVWNKETSNDNSYFEVERSFDQAEFKTVAILMIPGEDDFIAKGSFKFKDNSKDLAGKKQAWYRIKEVNNDGNVAYSPVKVVQLNPLATTEVSLFPNPFLQTINIKFLNHVDGTAEIKILNFNGEVVSSKKQSLIKGINLIEIAELSSASNGIYIVEISMNGAVTERQKIIKK